MKCSRVKSKNIPGSESFPSPIKQKKTLSIHGENLATLSVPSHFHTRKIPNILDAYNVDPSPSQGSLKHHLLKMQALLHLLPPPPPPLPIASTSKNLALQMRTFPRLNIPRCSPIKGSSLAADDASTVDYSSITSVFPAEACETIGGEACDVEMYPEVKLESVTKSTTTSPATEQIDTEYLDYNSPKTVFLEEACDDLGGEFCDPEYKKEPQ